MYSVKDKINGFDYSNDFEFLTKKEKKERKNYLAF